MDSTAVFVCVTEYGNLFPTLTFFLDGLHLTFGYKLIVGSETTLCISQDSPLILRQSVYGSVPCCPIRYYSKYIFGSLPVYITPEVKSTKGYSPISSSMILLFKARK